MKRLCLFVILALEAVAFYALQAKTLKYDGITYTYVPETGQAKGLKVEACPDGKAYPQSRIEIPRSINDGSDDYPVVALAENAFAGCENLTFLSLPDGITGVSWAIRNCPVLETVVLPNSLSSLYGIENCPNLRTIEFPESLADISWSINDCAVSAITLSADKTLNISRSFNNLSLDRLDLNNLEMIEYRSFCNLNALKIMKFPTSIKGIGLETFCKCSFEEIWFEDNSDGHAIKIDYEAFADTKVERIYMNCRTMPVLWSFWPFGYGAWPDCPVEDDDYQWAYTPFTYPFLTGADGERPTLADLRKINLYVPEGCGEMYNTDSYWGNFNVIEYAFGASVDETVQYVPEVSATVSDGFLTVDNPTAEPIAVTVYDSLGGLCDKFTVGASSVVSRHTARGLYIVNCGSVSHKVLVR